jgi:tetratricopeptide (TPR) repeat protein
VPHPALQLALLGVAGFSLAAWLEPWLARRPGNRAPAGDALTVLLGDSRRLFAQHFHAKADAYFHRGYYPSVFDIAAPTPPLRVASSAGTRHEGDAAQCADFLGEPRDWLERFGRHFHPTQHRHLGDDDCCQHHAHKPGEPCDHEHDHPRAERPAGEERELLPWLRLAAELDPQRPESYVVASYWLRSRLGKVDEAEQFLREGLRTNPGDCEILFELGRIYRENRHDAARARNLWELALAKWQEREAGRAEPNMFLRAQLLGQLAKLEEEHQNFPRAIEHLQLLREISPNKDAIQKWIEELKSKTGR